MFERTVSEHQDESFDTVEAARSYARHAQKERMKYGAFLDTLKALDRKGRYLDVGAGTGTPAVDVAKNHPDAEITALELFPAMIQVGEEYVDSQGLQDRVTFVLADAADKMAVGALGKFDLIYSTYSLHHWKEPGRVIRNLLDALVEDGILYLHDLRRVWWLYCIPARGGFFRSIRGAYVRGEVAKLLEELGVGSYEVKNEFPFLLSVIVRKTN
ncbi:MAG: class I SAM-dependent methyltransferase [Thermoleophilia bacterium]|nr:class I SAM-dependent methyltransferase [Thermoleophilia bacterium]